MHNMTCRYGVPMAKNSKEAPKDWFDEEPVKPKLMSEASLQALRVALAEGKECWIDHASTAFGCTRSKFRLTKDFILERNENDIDGWSDTAIGPDSWLSWSEVREPRVFEYETGPNPLPDELVLALADGSRFRVRYEEILKDKRCPLNSKPW